MDIALTETQHHLAEAARRYLADRYPADRVAAIAGGAGVAAAGWPELVRQGWLDPDLGMVELGLLAQESGYALHPTAWWTTAALTGLATPSTVVTGAITARQTADGWLLSGHAGLVPDAASAAVLLVRAGPTRAGPTRARTVRAGTVRAGPTRAGTVRAGTVRAGTVRAGTVRAGTVRAGTVRAGTAWFAVDADAARVRECASLDPLRRMYEVDLRQAPARPADPPGRDRAAALLACEAVGVAARAMDFAVDHAKTREQFGRPIGSFQAVAHQLADGYVELELARSLALRATWLVGADGGPAGADSGPAGADSGPDDADGGPARADGRSAPADGGPDERPSAVACAVIAGRRAAVRCCEVAIQILGGMGVSWEHPLHLWFRRALWLESYAGIGPDPHATLAADLFDQIAPEA